jgi:hypothetical protein
LKNSLFNAVITAALCCLVSSGSSAAGTAAQELKKLFEHYTEVWNRGDLMAIGTEVYLPPIQVYEAERTVSFDSAEDIAGLLRPLRRELDAAGFSHSKLRGVSVCELGGGLALASYRYSRYDNEGNSMGEPEQASAYIARRTGQGWRLVAHIMQPRVRDLSCD